MTDPPPPERILDENGNRDRNRPLLAIHNQPVTVNKFEISPTIYRELKEIHFSGKHNENANRHLTNFFELCETVKVDGCSEEGKMLRLFPFSLKDYAKEWLNCLPSNNINTWDDLENKFLEQYFPHLCSFDKGKRFLVTNKKKGNIFLTLTGGSRVY
ncbi:uncharacterized protein [Cicer arietinum]|uniref:uncharacterized protein n=1 Tax=Cicer arietinum TaxID=3827 RepID=UPI003CC69C31